MSSHGSIEYQAKERACMHEYASICNAEENLLKQKSRNKWLNLGDGNNAYFHKIIKVRNSNNIVKFLWDENGNIVEDMQPTSIRNYLEKLPMFFMRLTQQGFYSAGSKTVLCSMYSWDASRGDYGGN
jgi:hypothetical protein